MNIRYDHEWTYKGIRCAWLVEHCDEDSRKVSYWVLSDKGNPPFEVEELSCYSPSEGKLNRWLETQFDL